MFQCCQLLLHKTSLHDTFCPVTDVQRPLYWSCPLQKHREICSGLDALSAFTVLVKVLGTQSITAVLDTVMMKIIQHLCQELNCGPVCVCSACKLHYTQGLVATHIVKA
jgi:hypothetical protein